MTEPQEESGRIEAPDAEAANEGLPDGDGERAEIRPQQVVEAILMASDAPLSAGKIAAILDVGTAKDVRGHIDALNEQYKSAEMSFHIENIAGGYQILTLPEYNHWLGKLLQTRQETRLTPAAMETMAIVAYKQPCTRAEVEAIRGVAVGERLQKLREMNLVKIVGRAEDLGRPMLYGTTKRFLQVFGLGSLEDLPEVQSLRPPAAVTETPVDEQADDANANTEGAGHEELPIGVEADDSSDSSETFDDGDVRQSDMPDDGAETSNLTIVREEPEPEPSP